MSATLITQPNELSQTFRLASAYSIQPYTKIVIPFSDQELRDASPLAKKIFDSRMAIQRLDLTQQSGQEPILTLNLSSFAARAMPELKWNDAKKVLAQSVIDQFIESGEPLINSKLLKDRKAEPLYPIPHEKNAFQLYHVIKNVLTKLADKHGGAFEILDFVRFKNDSKLYVKVATFGACAGCSSFDKTYGQAEKEINKVLANMGHPAAGKIGGIIQHKQEDRRQGMLFKAAP